MKNFPYRIVFVALSCLFASSKISWSEEVTFKEIDKGMEDSTYRVILDMACLDSDFRQLINTSDSACTKMAASRLEECKAELDPILPGFGLQARMDGDARYMQKVESASLALIYCIQARSSFEPASQMKGGASAEKSERSVVATTTDIELIRKGVAQVPKDVTDSLFELATNSEYLMVTSNVGEGVFAVRDEKGTLVRAAPNNCEKWKSLMVAANINAVYVDDNHVRLQLDRFYDFNGVPVLVELSNTTLTGIPTCTEETTVRIDESGACQLQGTAYAGVELSWLFVEGGVSEKGY